MSLFSALNSSANALTTFERAMTVSQNNVSNSSTPGFAKQSATFEALPFVEGTGETGGVQSGTAQDSRNQFAEQNVWANSSQLGQSQQESQSLSALQTSFDVSGSSGIPAALSSLYSAFSNWSTATNSASGQQQVIAAANSVATSFQTTAAQVQQAASSADSSITATLSQINTLAAQLAGDNAKILAGGSNSGVSADIYNTLQQLSQLANISVSSDSSGTLTVMLGQGQTALVNGIHAQTLAGSIFVPQPPPPVNPNGPPTAHVLDSQKNDITAEFTGGSLSGLLNFRNQTLASIQGDGTQTGSLNQLAKTFADQVNSLLTHGYVSEGVQAMGTGSSNTVSQIISDPVNQASEAVAGQTQFVFRGPGFSDANGVSVAVNLAGVTDMASLATAVNSAITAAAAGNTPAAAAFKTANITASATTDAYGNPVLAFSSGSSVFQVQGADQTANALMGNFDDQASLTGSDTLPTVDTSVNNSLSIAFNGSATFTNFTLSAADSAAGTSKAAIAADLNSQTAFAANAKAYVDSANQLIIQSNQASSGSEIQISSTGTDLAASLGLATSGSPSISSSIISDALAGSSPTGTGSVLAGSETTYDSGGAQTTPAMAFSPIQSAGDSQTISITSTDANGTAHSTQVLLADTASTQNAGSIDQAISAINAQLQGSNDPTLQGIVAVKEITSSKEQIKFMSLHAFQITPGTTASGAGMGSQGTNIISTLSAGGVSTGKPTANGTALFTYDAANATNMANSLKVSPSITEQNLAAISGTSTGTGISVSSGNGVALALANLATSPNAALGGQTYTQYFGSIAATVGSQLSTAQTSQTSAQDQLTQAESLRQQVSGVDLNQEAAQILQFQQAYTAASKIISVIDSMTQTVLGLVTPSQVV